MLNLKESIKYRNNLRRAINQNFEKAKYIIQNVSENNNSNELLAIKTITGENYFKIKALNEDIWNKLLEQEGDNDREIEIEEKTCDKLDLEYRKNFFQIEGFMTNNSFFKTTENNSRQGRPSTSATALYKKI